METPLWQKKIDEILEREGNRRINLLPCLEAVNAAEGYICPQAVEYLSDRLQIHPVDIHGTISFSGMLSVRQQGKYVIKLCDSRSCRVKDDMKLLEALTSKLGIAPGESTSDGKYTIETDSCENQCSEAPVITINEMSYGDLTLPKLNNILACIS